MSTMDSVDLTINSKPGKYRGLRDSDVVISASAHDFEPESLAAFKSWFKEWNKEVYTVGPLIPSKPTTFVVPSNNARGSGLVEKFLDKAFAEYGPKSAVLVSSMSSTSRYLFMKYRRLDLIRVPVLAQ